MFFIAEFSVHNMYHVPFSLNPIMFIYKVLMFLLPNCFNFIILISAVLDLIELHHF
jgi:hypothetical protein